MGFGTPTREMGEWVGVLGFILQWCKGRAVLLGLAGRAFVYAQFREVPSGAHHAFFVIRSS